MEKYNIPEPNSLDSMEGIERQEDNSGGKNNQDERLKTIEMGEVLDISIPASIRSKEEMMLYLKTRGVKIAFIMDDFRDIDPPFVADDTELGINYWQSHWSGVAPSEIPFGETFKVVVKKYKDFEMGEMSPKQDDILDNLELYSSIFGDSGVDVEIIKEVDIEGYDWKDMQRQRNTNREKNDMSPEPFSDITLFPLKNKENELILEWLKDEIEGRPILDIGPGMNTNGYEIANLLQGEGYIGVEPFFAKSLASELKDEKGEIKPLVVNEDALTFFKKIKDNSVHVITFGTDSLMLRDREYNEQLNKEIARVIGDSGLFIGNNTTLYPAGRREHKIKFSRPLSSPTIIFSKKLEEEEKPDFVS